jgi:hypothetical protein
VVEIAEVFPQRLEADLMKAYDRSGEPLRHPKRTGEHRAFLVDGRGRPSIHCLIIKSIIY